MIHRNHSQYVFLQINNTVIYTSAWNFTNTGTAVNALAFNYDASLIAAGCGGTKMAFIFNNNSNAPTNNLTFSGNVKTVDFSSDNKIFAGGDDAGNMNFYDFTNNFTNFQNITSLGGISSIDFSNDSCWLAVALSNNSLFFYSVNCFKKQATGCLLLSFPVRNRSI